MPHKFHLYLIYITSKRSNLFSLQYGYYRVNYPADDWSTLSEVLLENPEAISVSDRANLINDAFNLAKGGRLPFSTALQVLVRLRRGRGRVINEGVKLVKGRLPFSTALQVLVRPRGGRGRVTN